jgi:hypothetical protein
MMFYDWETIPFTVIYRLYIKCRFVKKNISHYNIIEGPILILGVRTNDNILEIFWIIQEFEMKVYGVLFTRRTR